MSLRPVSFTPNTISAFCHIRELFHTVHLPTGDRIYRIRKWPVTKLGNLFIEAFCHLADLTALQGFNAKTPGQFLHFSGGYALYKSLLNNLNERSLTALALRDEERDIAALADLGTIRYISHSCIQMVGAIATAIAVSAVRMCTFLSVQLLVRLGLHELLAEPLRHAKHRIRMRYTFQ